MSSTPRLCRKRRMGTLAPQLRRPQSLRISLTRLPTLKTRFLLFSEVHTAPETLDYSTRRSSKAILTATPVRIPFSHIHTEIVERVLYFKYSTTTRRQSGIATQRAYSA